MKNLLRLEDLAQFMVCVLALIFFDVPWWCYFLLLLGPDISILGYLVNTRVGAIAYNLLHHKGVAIAFVLAGMPGQHENINMVHLDMGHLFMNPLIALGIIIYGHASMDRIFGFGLKFSDSFQHTHVGWIGKATHNQNE